METYEDEVDQVGEVLKKIFIRSDRPKCKRPRKRKEAHLEQEEQSLGSDLRLKDVRRYDVEARCRADPLRGTDLA